LSIPEGKPGDLSDKPVTWDAMSHILKLMQQQYDSMQKSVDEMNLTMKELHACLEKNEQALDKILHEFIIPLDVDYKNRVQSSNQKKDEIKSIRVLLIGTVVGTAVSIVVRLFGF
jgi:hypothetical protein